MLDFEPPPTALEPEFRVLSLLPAQGENSGRQFSSLAGSIIPEFPFWLPTPPTILEFLFLKPA